ncbi:MAG: FAD-binding oxidoreductase [Methylocystis sp.]|nr:FAD-binding oxidoreductase [Methylocystis sp.]MCA3583249.1 FAD-binding oxidoreductase [Methylocystis sp.]MCA3588034.1 FAD-binding oxidoreductase [Methylocystis sp.]MCA3590673.1 FAD-binding oxidoreductase [Methylocystis sp.]
MRRAVLASPASQPLLPRLAGIVGPRHVVTDPDIMAPHLREWRNLYAGKAQALVRPGSTAEVAAILRLAQETGTPVVPQGGNTGGVGGQVPDLSGRAILLSLARLDKVRDIQPLSNLMTVEAGVVLQAVQAAAESVDRFFPMSLPSEGSCMIGGNLATNAGGTGVIAYGNTRDLVLGLEAVLPDGRIWNGLSGLRKDNAGYEMKHLFIGSEGTLGVITAATLKLFPRPRSRVTGFIGLASPEAALRLLARAQAGSGGTVTTFELIPRIGIEMVLQNGAQARDPLAGRHAWYVLLEVSSQQEDGLQDAVEAMLAGAFDAGEAEDAVLASSLDQRLNLWKLREDLPFAQATEGASIKHDISVPIASVPGFMAEALAMLESRFPGCRPCPFGHLGDGNLHFNVTQPKGADPKAFLALYEEMNMGVFDIVARYGGSIAAEHGVGQHKRKLLPRYKDPVALDLMRMLKHAIDPKGIMNPGKVL